MYREIPSASSASALSLLGPEELDAGASFTVVVLRVRKRGGPVFGFWVLWLGGVELTLTTR